KADTYLSVNSGSYVLLSGSFLVTQNSVLRAYAERGSGTGKVRSAVLELVYILPKKTYVQEVIFSEVYPSPVSTGSSLETEEWVELHNLTDRDILLAGWILDDIENGGSKPWTVTADTIVPASGSVVLLRHTTGVALNNGGDSLRLVSPDGARVIAMQYPKISKGKAYALVGSSWCITDTPTPHEQNICTINVPLKKRPRHSAVTRSSAGTKTKAVQARRFLWERYRTIVAGDVTEKPSVPLVMQSLRHLQGIAVPEKKSSTDAEVLIVSLLLLPALRLLTL
ncbi:hypothetical protein COU78_04045, partial [Candidatus Peregrinibacteria bacterium CG10_big_fil_rev_8_21_14_0_10_49_24]